MAKKLGVDRENKGDGFPTPRLPPGARIDLASRDSSQQAKSESAINAEVARLACDGLISLDYLPQGSVAEGSGETILIPGGHRISVAELRRVIDANPTGSWPWSEDEINQITIN